MKITDAAKTAFQSEMTRQNFDSIRMFVENTENGQILKLEIQNNDDNARSIDVKRIEYHNRRGTGNAVGNNQV